jgi:serine/threonine protein phosphatase PrpC
MITSTVAILHDNVGHGEDQYVVRTLDNNAFLDAVMDGVTGRRGWEASQITAEALAVAPLTSPADLRAVLEDVNDRLYRRGWGRFLLTTIAAALCLDGTLYTMGAGDSPIVLIRSETWQFLSSRTSGFSPLGPARAIGISQHLGNLYHTEVTLVPGDRVVLATDGVMDAIPRAELIEIVRGAASPDAAVQQLHTLLATRQREAQARGEIRRDDSTAIVRFFSAADASADKR